MLASASVTPRSGSPTKLTPRVRNGVTSPRHTPKVPSYGGSTLRSAPTYSAPVTPELKARTVITASPASSIGPQEDDARSRSGSVSLLHHAVSFSSFRPSPMAYSVSERSGVKSATSSPGPKLDVNKDRETTSSPSLKIRSKVTSVAKRNDSSLVSPPSGLSPSSAHRPTHPSERRARNASVSSVISHHHQQPPTSPPQFYPITTATSAANPHRYDSTRSPPPRTIVPTASQVFQSPAERQDASREDDSPLVASNHRAKINGVQAKVDPSAVAPLSPPMSSVSFSSRSTVSRSSASVSAIDDGRLEFSSTSVTSSSHLSPTQEIKTNGNADCISFTLNNLIQYTTSLPSANETAGGTDGESADEEHQVKAAAKSNRKVRYKYFTLYFLLSFFVISDR